MRRVRQLSVEAAYDLWAATYDGADNPMTFAAARALEALDDVAGAVVVEFGCGTGRNLAQLQAKGAAGLIGLDLSAAMLAKAAARSDAFRLLRHDAAAPAPLRAASADLVLFCLTLEHMAALAPPFAEAARLLRPGGRLVVFEIHPFLALQGVAAHFSDGAEEVRMPVYAHGFADYLNGFAAAGLAVERCREWRAADLGPGAPAAAGKRGPATPLAVEFTARPRA